MSENDELRNYVDAGLSRYERSEPDDLDELEDDEDQGAEAAGSTTDEEALPDGWNDWVDSLTAAEIERAKGDADWAEYAFGVWQTRAETAFEPTDDQMDDAGEPKPRTGGELIDWIRSAAAADPAGFRRDTGTATADEYIASLARADRASWEQWANRVGVPLSARPSYSQLGRGGQAALVRADLNAMTPEAFERLGK
jgi:hypothetical protein